MLIHLSIHHFAVVEHLELDIQAGMTVLTGETGAGKSILIDALQLVLGGRADSTVIRQGCPQVEISATYDLSLLATSSAWLQEHALDADGECIIRRIITQDGRSRATINGKTVPLNQVRDLGEQLVNIHGQHQHQVLLKPEHQRLLLDAYAMAEKKDSHSEYLKNVRKNHLLCQKLRKEQEELLGLQGQSDKLILLQYQIQEIDELNLQENELQLLEAEHKQLAHSEHWLLSCETALTTLKNDSGQDAFSAIHSSQAQIAPLKTENTQLNTGYELLGNALIQLEEAVLALENFKKNLISDPMRLMEIDKRLGQIHALARKHRIQAVSILDHKKNLKQEAATLLNLQNNLESINAKLQEAEKSYQDSAQRLSQSRQKIALVLEKQLTQNLRTLEMPNGHFIIEFSQKNASGISPHGVDDIEFLVSTNPGLAPQPLRKIASGGELSRISLAIQVISAKKLTTPTLIFDEVDAGISGKTAETVGKLLRTLSANAQVLCVTHLPQIAAQGHQHLNVSKKQSENNTSTEICVLNTVDKIQELARMLGGATITQHALAHAKEMLESVA